jgi:hypothetical protein
MFNDFNDLETFRASDKRTSSDFNKYLKYLNTFKMTSSNNGHRPSSPKTAILVVLLPTPRENLQNLICTFSCFMFLLKLRDFQGVGYGFFSKQKYSDSQCC